MGKTTDDILAKLDVKTQNQGKQLLRFLKMLRILFLQRIYFMHKKNRVRPSICPLFTEPLTLWKANPL